MKKITVLLMGALLTTLAACGDDSDQQSWPATFLMQQCSPVDPHCQLAEPPHVAERPAPGAQ